MEPQKQYLKYSAPLKKQCVLHLIACVLMLATALMILFVPNFRIDLNRVPAEELAKDTTLPKLLTFDVLLDPVVEFSLWDELYASFFAGSALIYFPVFTAIFLAAGLSFNVAAVVRDVLHLLSPEDYALLSYDKLRDPAGIKRLRSLDAQAYSFLIPGVIFLITTVVFNLTLTSDLSSYFAVITGITAGSVFCALLLIAAIALFALSGSAMQKIKLSVLREDYEKPRESAEES